MDDCWGFGFHFQGLASLRLPDAGGTELSGLGIPNPRHSETKIHKPRIRKSDTARALNLKMASEPYSFNLVYPSKFVEGRFSGAGRLSTHWFLGQSQC